MLDEKKFEEIRRNVPLLLKEREIVKKEENKKLVNFYLENALLSLNAAKIIYEISSDAEKKKYFSFLSQDFEAYLWVVNPSYYSIFYMASALLASEGIKIHSEIGIHRKTFECLVYYFYFTNRFPKYLLEIYEEAQQESLDLLGREELFSQMKEKTKDLIWKYDAEMTKRSTFTYNIGEKAKQNKAETSLKRAVEFYNEIRLVLEREK